MFRVYRRMLLQIMREYPSLPDPRTMTVDEIVFCYDDLRTELHEQWRLKQKLKAKVAKNR